MENKIVEECVIEIPVGTKNKFEINKATGRIKLDRVIYSAMTYPGEYGYIENTLALDGDPLDVLVISSYPTFPGCYVDARIVGYLEVIDNGFNDEKVIAVVDKDPRFDHIHELSDITNHQKEEIKDFFQTYKTLQRVKVEALDFHDKEEARKLIQACKDRYEESKKQN